MDDLNHYRRTNSSKESSYQLFINMMIGTFEALRLELVSAGHTEAATWQLFKELYLFAIKVIQYDQLDSARANPDLIANTRPSLEVGDDEDQTGEGHDIKNDLVLKTTVRRTMSGVMKEKGQHDLRSFVGRQYTKSYRPGSSIILVESRYACLDPGEQAQRIQTPFQSWLGSVYRDPFPCFQSWSVAMLRTGGSHTIETTQDCSSNNKFIFDDTLKGKFAACGVADEPGVSFRTRPHETQSPGLSSKSPISLCLRMKNNFNTGPAEETKVTTAIMSSDDETYGPSYTYPTPEEAFKPYLGYSATGSTAGNVFARTKKTTEKSTAKEKMLSSEVGEPKDLSGNEGYHDNNSETVKYSDHCACRASGRSAAPRLEAIPLTYF
ncbi:hypothetical protein FMUND_953 [Fusarium mundagurra]|uniref:Uncharacterized protein n=1 Tax=Fusarium mundagurra TaxID=1567541 RepID=A0A8H5Z7I5_9HYPO|nr:hypothetical protein FMUND_953 [Fusarium mundagurra]